MTAHRSKTHERWADQLSDYLNGDLDADAAEALENHLASCGACRDALAELREIVAAARTLGEIQPPRELWGGIAAAISAPIGRGKVIQLPTAHRVPEGKGGLLLSRRQLAAAAAVIMVISAAATWAVGLGMPGASVAESGEPVSGVPGAAFAAQQAVPPDDMAEELAGLEALMSQGRAALDPATVRVLEKNLAVIEAAIQDSYRALALEPGNAFLTEHLERAFQRKVDYLNNVARVAGWSG